MREEARKAQGRDGRVGYARTQSITTNSNTPENVSMTSVALNLVPAGGAEPRTGESERLKSQSDTSEVVCTHVQSVAKES